MRRLYCFTVGFFLLSVRAEKEDFQGYNAEQTKGTTVTKDLLLKEENAIGQGIEAVSTENTHHHTAVAVAAKFPEAFLFDTRPTPSYERTQITKASDIFGLMNSFVSRNGQTSLTSTKDNPSVTRIHNESEPPLISDYDKIVFSSTRAAFESKMNGTSEPGVYLSTDAVKASLWLHTLLDNRNQRNTDSITLTSADRGPGVPILSASHPRVIDNLAVLRNDNDDKRSQDKDNKGVSNLERNKYPLATVQSIFQSNTAEDSVRGNTVTNMCLTCQRDRREVSTEKSVALPALSPHGSSDSPSIEGLTFDLSQFTTSLPSLHQQSVGEQEEMLNKDISQQSITKHSSSEMREQPVYNLTSLSTSPSKTVNHGHSVLNNSQIKSFLSDTGTVAFDALSLAEISSATQKNTEKQLRPISTTTAFYRSSKSDYTVRKQETLGKKVSIWDPQSKLIHFSKHNNNTSHSLSTNFKTTFVRNEPLDFKSGAVSKPADITEAPHNSQKSVFPEGSDHSAASHPTARMRLIEAHSASFSLSRPTTSAVKNPESHSLTRRDDSLITVLKSQTPAQPSSKTKVPILTLLLKDSGVKFTSVTTKRHLTDKQDSQTVYTVNSIVKQYSVDPSGPANEPVVKEPQPPTLTTTKVVVPVKLFLSESRQDLDNDVSTSTLTTISRKSFSERMTASRLSGSQSKITQERMYDVSNDNHVAPTRQSSLKYNRDSLIVHNLKPGDKNEQVLTVVAEDEDKEIIKSEGEQGEEIKETEEIVKLRDEEESRDNEKLGNKRGELFRSDKMENGKQEKIINAGAEINQNRERDEFKMEAHEAETSKEEGGGTIGEEDITLRQEKHPRHGEVRDEEGAGKGVTKKNTENSTEDVTEQQRASLTKEEAEARGREAASKQDIKCNREIGREDMTNVPLGLTTKSKDLMRDKGHTDITLSSCHSLIKQLRVPEHEDIHSGEHVAQIVEMKNKSLSHEVTSNHRPVHSNQRSQSPKPSRVTSVPKEPNTQIKPSTHMLTKHGPTSSLTKGSTQVKVVEALFSVTAMPKLVPKPSEVFGVSISKISDALEPTISPHSSASKSTHPVLKSNMLPPTTPRLAITAEFLRAQPHITVNSSTLSLSILHRISDHMHKFSTMVSKENSLLQNLNEREKAQHIIPAGIFESSVKNPLTSEMIERVYTSTSMNSAPTQQMYNDSSTRPPTAKALSSVAHTSIGRPHQRQSAPQTNQPASSAFGMTSGQPRSFKLSAQTAHSDALHGPVDDNEQRSVRTLMASMSPKAENNQFPLSSMSLLPNLMLLGDDSLPGTYSLTGLTRSASEKEVLRANSDTGYANSESGHAEILLGTADETNQTENGSMQKMVTSGVKHSYVVTKQMAESRDEKNSFPLKEQTTSRGEHYVSNTEGFNSLSTEELAVKSTNEDKHNDLFIVDGSDDANKTVKATLESNHSQLGGYNKTSAQLIMPAIQTTHKMEEAINEDFVSVTNDSAVPVLDTNDPTGTTVFVESDSLPEIPQIQANDVTNNAISDIEHHTAKAIEKQHDPSTPQGTAGDAVSLPQIHFENDLKVPIITTQQIADRIMNVTAKIQITTTKTNDFVSLGSTASVSSLIVSREAHESAQTVPESVRGVIEKSLQAAHTDRMVQSNSHIGPLPLREPPVTGNTGKHTPAVKRRNTTEREISVQVIEQSQHAQPGMIAVTHAIKDPAQTVQAGLLKAAYGDGETYDTTYTLVEKVESSSFEDVKTLTTKGASEAKHPLHENTPTVPVRGDQHEPHALLPEKTSISQRTLGAVYDSVTPTGITPTENKTNCRTTGCANSGATSETTIGAGEIDHTALEQIYKTQAGNTEGDHLNAAHTPVTKIENGSCSTNCPVPDEATPQATNLDSAGLSPASSKSDHDHATVDETTPQNAKSMTNETSTRTWRVLVETDHLGRRGELEQAQIVEKTTHPHRQTSKAQEAVATEVTLSEPAPTTVQTTETTTERMLLAEKNIKTQLNRGAAKAEIFEAQNATRSARAAAKGETGVQESGRGLLLLEPQSESELLKHRRRTSPHLYLSGVTEVSDDLCGSGNYTAEMSLNLGRGVEPGDAVPALGNLRVVINLKTNNSRINLGVTSCCLSPTTKPDLINSTCCLFSRLAAEPAGITLLPTALSTSASFTISLFQMINYSVVYLHCDLSVCLRNRSDCERQCLQQRSAFPSEDPEAVVTNLRNRISFGPMLKEVKNSTSSEEIDPPELDLVLVIVSLVVVSSLVTVTLLLVWLAYRRRAIWLFHSTAPPRACCGCLHPGGDLVLP